MPDDINQLAIQLYLHARRRKVGAQHRLNVLLTDLQSGRIGHIGSGGERDGGRIDLAHKLVVLTIESPGKGRIVGSDLFEQAQVLEDFLSTRT